MKTDLSMKIIRAMTAACILPAMIMTGTVTFAQPDRVKTTEELIAEVEAEARKPASAPAGVPLANEPKSAAEILAEIEALSTPTNASAAGANLDTASGTETDTDTVAEPHDVKEVKEESEETANADEAGSATEELPVDNSPLPDEVIGEYAVDENDDDGLDLEIVDEADAGAIASAALQSLPEVASETLYEKADALEPQLLLSGTPVEEGVEGQVSEKISGRIVAEKQPLARRRHLFRWVLKADDGRRIPLKSNIKLLQEVRRDNILDGKVALTGRYIRSGLNDKLRYFVVESLVALDDEAAEAAADKAAGKASERNKNNAVADSEAKKAVPLKEK